MGQNAHSFNVLIVSAQPKLNASLLGILGERRNYITTVTDSVSSAKALLRERIFDLVLINAPLPDDDGVKLSIELSSGTGCAVLLMINADRYSEIFDLVFPHGVYTLPKPTVKIFVTQALDWLECTCGRLGKISERSRTLEDRMKEIRLINRAKWLLISSRGMTEDEAHRYIQKQAMDDCTSKLAVAERLIGSM
ncbi:MAG: response regulator [Ruminococcus sp.]|nr:response regulator [Ruminococcus sp.]